MPIPNFSTLLEDILAGNKKALKKLYAYVDHKEFNDEEIHQTLQRIGLVSDNSPQKSHALYLHAIMHEYGLGCPQNSIEAIRIWEQAIKLGNNCAINNLAMTLEQKGGEHNITEAIVLYKQAIKLGNTDAMNNLAVMRAKEGGEQNIAEAIALYKQAIELGDLDAKILLSALQAKQNSQEKPLNNELKTYENKFKALLEKLEKESNLLNKKAESNNQYKDIATKVAVLHTGLDKEMKYFFNKPTKENFTLRHQRCAILLKNTLDASKEHRGWYKVNKII